MKLEYPFQHISHFFVADLLFFFGQQQISSFFVVVDLLFFFAQQKISSFFFGQTKISSFKIVVCFSSLASFSIVRGQLLLIQAQLTSQRRRPGRNLLNVNLTNKKNILNVLTKKKLIKCKRFKCTFRPPCLMFVQFSSLSF